MQNILALLFTVLFVVSCTSPQKSSRIQTSSVKRAHKKSLASPTSQAYNRKLYKHWVDADGDCQDTRVELLIATSEVPPKFKTSKKCKVVSGRWYDAYSGIYITQASKIDIDHIIPLRAAHAMGANRWTANRRKLFANDLENLIPVSRSLNRSKGAKSPHAWMPPNKAYHCKYLERWLLVENKYQLNEKRSPASETVEQTRKRICLKN